MNIAQQMASFQMQRIEGSKPEKSLAGVSERSFNKGKSKRDDFLKVLGNTLEKAETCKPTSCAPVNGRDELQKPVNESKALDTETNKFKVEETGSPEGTGSIEVTGSDETDRMLLLQIADLLKLLGISVDEKDVLSRNGGLVRETVNQQEQAGMILQELSAREAVLRLVQMLEGLTASGNNNVTPSLRELKSLAEALSKDLNSLPDERFLTKLVKVLEKALGNSTAEKTDSAAPAVEAKKQSPVIETVSDNLSIEATDASEASAGINMKAAERSGSDSAQNDDNGFNLSHSEIINPRNERPVVSGHGFSMVDEALTNEQPTQVYKLTQSLFGQIAQKAKVIVLPGVTEMQIQLKPGFLGRLNMSIISENGTVTARFTAETQAVKGIIEANLNSLKDTLNQQGIKVEQLVVDIGTHNHHPGFEQRQNMYRGQNGSKNNRISVNAEEAERMFSTEIQNGDLKNYYGSTVEFTA